MSGQRPEWATTLFDSFDTETTGVNVEEDRIVTATVLTIEPVHGVAPIKNEWLINPGVEIPEGATEVHGITTEHAREHGVDPVEALTRIRDALYDCWDNGRVLVIYNAPYDLTITDRELRRHGLSPLGVIGPVYDPLVVDKRIFERVRGKGARQLMSACKRYGITLTEKDAHSSAGDALAAARLMYKQATAPQVNGLSLAQLNECQRAWFEVQQESFARWLSTQPDGKERARQVREETERGFPLRAYRDELAVQGELAD